MPDECTATVDVDTFMPDGRITFLVEVNGEEHTSGAFTFRYAVETEDDDYTDEKRTAWDDSHGLRAIYVKEDLGLPDGHVLTDVDLVGGSVACRALGEPERQAEGPGLGGMSEDVLEDVRIEDELAAQLTGARLPSLWKKWRIGTAKVKIDEVEFVAPKVRDPIVVAGNIRFGKIRDFPIARTEIQSWRGENPYEFERDMINQDVDVATSACVDWSLERKLVSRSNLGLRVDFGHVFGAGTDLVTEMGLTEKDGHARKDLQTVTTSVKEKLAPKHWGEKTLLIEEVPSGANFWARVVLDAKVWGDLNLYYDGKKYGRVHLKKDKRRSLSKFLPDPSDRAVDLWGFANFVHRRRVVEDWKTGELDVDEGDFVPLDDSGNEISVEDAMRSLPIVEDDPPGT